MQRGVCMCKKDQINQNQHTQERRGLDFGRLDTDRIDAQVNCKICLKSAGLHELQ